jgi:DHA1 family purine base/nucleoside efflux pump-like MFS transporter
MSARIYLLAAGAFAVGTSAYVVSGVLPVVSAELDVSITAAGQLTTVFALAYAVSAPLLATITARWERRRLLLIALLVAALGNALSAVATTYPLLLGGRIVAALGAAAFTPAATLFATALRPPAERGRAVAIVFGGMTVALALGVPMGSILAGSIGFRGVFALVAAVSVATALAVRLQLPVMAGSPSVPLRERFAVAADRRVLLVLAITVFGVVATMCVYIYVVPLLTLTTGLAGSTIGALLLAYGLGAIVGNAWGGRATDRFGSIPTIFATMAGFIVMIATLPVTATTAVGAAVALFVWSVFTWSFNPPVQSLLLELSPSGLVLSLNASAIYLGMGLAGVLGGVVIDVAGALALPVVGAVLGLACAALLLALRAGTRRAAVLAAA